MKPNTIINISVVDDEHIKALNKEYLKKDTPTDVLSFQIGEDMEDGSYYLGDIVVNKDQAERQAKDYGNTLEEEIAALVEHGVLHLLGVHHPHDDENDVHGIPVK